MKIQTIVSNIRKRNKTGVPVEYTNAWEAIKNCPAGNFVEIHATTNELTDIRSMLLYMHKHKVVPKYIVSLTNKDDSAIVICRQRELPVISKLCGM